MVSTNFSADFEAVNRVTGKRSRMRDENEEAQLPEIAPWTSIFGGSKFKY